MRSLHLSKYNRWLREAMRFIMILGLFILCSQFLNYPSAFPEEDKWGVRVTAVRLSGAGQLIDFRYRVTDGKKAATLLDRDKKAYLIDQATGKEMPVLQSKLGPLRSTAVKPKEDRQYVVLFSNANKTIKKGSKVTAVIGDYRVEDLTVE